MNPSVSNTGVNDREEWRARILRALAELREGDHHVLRRSGQHDSQDEAPASTANP